MSGFQCERCSYKGLADPGVCGNCRTPAENEVIRVTEELADELTSEREHADKLAARLAYQGHGASLDYHGRNFPQCETCALLVEHERRRAP